MHYLCIVDERDKSTLLNLKTHNTLVMKAIKTVYSDKIEIPSIAKRICNSIEKGTFKFQNVGQKGVYYGIPVDVRRHSYGWVINVKGVTIMYDMLTFLVFVD